MTKPNHRFIANQPRGQTANCAPYLTPPVRANIAAFVAKQRPLGAWPPPLPWEHSSRWSCPSPRGSSHSDADHAWVHRPDNDSPFVRRCGKFPRAFRDGDIGQTLDLAQQLASLGSGINRPDHGSSDGLDSERWKTDSW